MSEDIQSIADLQQYATQIGPDTWITKSFYGDEWVGLIEFHMHGETVSGGYIPFNGASTTAGDQWTVVSREPLTLSPSIACRSCSHHGWIRDGKWVAA